MNDRYTVRCGQAAAFSSALLFFFAAGSSFAVERITSFHSDIVVESNSSLTVTETIDVIAEGNQIKHGIYRDFPTIYRDSAGKQQVVGFHLTSVRLDDRREDYHTEDEYNGVRIYVGNRNRYVSPGTHRYVLRYEADRELGFHEDHDELYWNVTGNGWTFPMTEASAAVDLPAGIARDAVHVLGYTGPQGSREQALTASVADDIVTHFATTRPLNAHEGLTIVVTWPKGFVHPPGLFQRLNYFLRDNRAYEVVFLILLLLSVYYYFVWNKVGRDPRGGSIIPLYEPPANLSPASVRFIEQMSYDPKAFAAQVIHLAVQGALTIEEHEPFSSLFQSSSYILRRTAQTPPMSRVESVVYTGLFAEGDEATLSKTYDPKIDATTDALRGALEAECKGVYFNTNTLYLFLGIFLSILAGYCCIQYPQDLGLSRSIFPFVWLAGGLLLINGIFASLMKAPTPLGRQVMDKIEGFRLFLSYTEKDRLNLLNPPEKTPALFEKYLPFALALGVEQHWGEQFAKVFASHPRPDGTPYVPLWYSGGSWSSFGPGQFATTMSSSMASVISSASTAPSSSGGGGGGGGSSGGGGGGGGGGGW